MSDNSNDQQFIDVRRLMKELSVEELCQTAEDYFKQIPSWDYHMALPFTGIDETPEMLIHFAQLLQGLRPLPGMTVLDFGAGSCWTSRYLTQMGYEVIALDVSATALKMGEELFRRQPVFGPQPESRFLHFDGHRIDLPDQSVDRISCLNSFHHVPNPEHILKEMARVLKQGGVAGFSEPGPEHSRSPQSQYEMRLHKVVENDIRIEEIWSAAQRAGFTDLKLAVFNSLSYLLSLPEFERYLAEGRLSVAATVNTLRTKIPSRLRRLLGLISGNRQSSNHSAPEPLALAGDPFAEQTRAYMRDRRMFFLYKGEAPAPDSRQRAGLMAEMQVELASRTVAEGEPFLARIMAKNSGTTIWLPISAPKGPVRLGAHLLDRDGNLVDLNFFRTTLMEGDGRAVAPGETVNIETPIPSPARGRYLLVFDLVSEGVSWFATNGSQTVRLEVEVT
jgi:ubiquinone/menaquinone biosynthesis C-methylase UbiE